MLCSQEVRPLDVDDLLSAPVVVVTSGTPIVVSPDGRRVAMTLRDRRRVTSDAVANTALATPQGTLVAYLGTDIWVARTSDGALTRITGARGANWGPSWSPDGRNLAFFSDRDGAVRVWCWNEATGQVRRISEASAQTLDGSASIQWLPDGSAILVQLFPDEVSAWDLIAPDANRAVSRGDTMARVVVYSEQGMSAAESEHRFKRQPVLEWLAANRGRADLAVIAVATGRVERLTHGAIPSRYWLSPNGREVAYTTIDTSTNDYRRTDLRVVSVSEGDQRTIVSGIPQSLGFNVSWSPDGSLLAYMTTSGPDAGECYVVSLEHAEPERITVGPHPRLRSPSLQGPQWTSDGTSVYLLGDDTLWRADVAHKSVHAVAHVPGRRLLRIIGPSLAARAWSPDGGRSLLIETQDRETMRAGVARVDLRTGGSRLVLEEDRAHGSAITTDVFGQRVVYLSESATDHPELWVTDDAFGSRRRLTHLSPTLDDYKFGTSRLVHWRGLDGQALTGVLLLPAGYRPGKRYPMVVSLYGGFRPAASLNHFGLASPATDGLNLQLFATRGYAVLVPDAPIRAMSPVHDLGATVLPGVNRVVELGVADPDRLAITGHSFGGFSALALAALTPRFKAVVSRGGFSDLVAYGMTLDAYGQSWAVYNTEHGPQSMDGSLWERRPAFIENSPVYHLDKVQAPVLLIHSTTDWPSPVHLADETFVALRRLGRRVTYAKYVGEEHEELFWRYADARDMLHRILSWFDEYVASSAPSSVMPHRR